MILLLWVQIFMFANLINIYNVTATPKFRFPTNTFVCYHSHVVSETGLIFGLTFSVPFTVCCLYITAILIWTRISKKRTERRQNAVMSGTIPAIRSAGINRVSAVRPGAFTSAVENPPEDIVFDFAATVCGSAQFSRCSSFL